VITGILVLPLFSIATVTSSFARMTLTLLGILLCVVGIAALSAFFEGNNVSTPYSDRISIPLLLCICGAVIVLQYAARKVWLSRLLLITLPVLLGIVALATPDAALMRRAYPRPAGPQDALVQLSLSPDSLHRMTAYQRDAKRIGINLPLHASGVADGYAVIPNDVAVSIDAPDGSYWTSPWQAIYNQNYLPGSQNAHIGFTISRAFFDRVKSMPVTLHLTFALTQVQAGKVSRIPLPTSDFFIPDFGVCSPESGWFDPSKITGLACRSALRHPRLTYVSVLWSNAPCSASQPEPNTGVEGGAWAGNLDNDLAEFGISSVWMTPVALSNGWGTFDDQSHRPGVRYLCPGTPLIFTQYNLVRHSQADLTIANFHLPPLTPPGMLSLSVAR
jgi:hypothetical protein